MRLLSVLWTDAQEKTLPAAGRQRGKARFCEMTIQEIKDILGQNIEVARHPRMQVYLPIDRMVPKDTMMRLKVFDKKDYL